MSPEQGFIQALVEDPHDDTSRLIYADWLMERGDPRGEFIRVQTERERLAPHDEQAGRLRVREQQLLAAHRDEWTAPLRPLGPHCKVEFRYGFVYAVTVVDPVSEEDLACLRDQF